MEVKTLICAFILLTQRNELTFCQVIDDYTADKKYYKVNLTLPQVPDNIPAEAREVYLSWNNITIIESNVFARLTQCTLLELNHNEIFEVKPEAFNGLRALKWLRLHHNKLECLHMNMFFILNNCVELNIGNNQISKIESGGFNGLSNLKHLRLSDNRLTELDTGTFQGLVALDELWVNGNSINTIKNNTFANLKKLRIIWLDNNNLEALSPGMFTGLESLEHLTLELNRLTRLPADVFNHLPRPLTLGLQDAAFRRTPDNQLQCDSHLCWLKQEELQGTVLWYIYGKYPSSPYKPRCAGGILWDTWTCDGAIKTTVKTTESTEKQEPDDIRKWITIVVGVAVVFLCVLIVVICLKRRSTKVCKRSSPKGDDKGIEETNDIHNPGLFITDCAGEIQGQNQQVGFTNRRVSMTTVEEPGYIGLQREPDSYEYIPSSVNDSGYMIPNNQTPEYLDVLEDSASFSSDFTASFINQAVPMKTDNEAGYARPQSQQEGCVGVTDYADSMPSHTERRVSMEIESESAYSRPCSQSEGYVGITDYTDSP